MSVSDELPRPCGIQSLGRSDASEIACSSRAAPNGRSEKIVVVVAGTVSGAIVGATPFELLVHAEIHNVAAQRTRRNLEVMALKFIQYGQAMSFFSHLWIMDSVSNRTRARGFGVVRRSIH